MVSNFILFLLRLLPFFPDFAKDWGDVSGPRLQDPSKLPSIRPTIHLSIPLSVCPTIHLPVCPFRPFRLVHPVRWALWPT